ncbi:hypothetical protein CP061683_0368A, partial [Chlamydia psittaci 06-1683]
MSAFFRYFITSSPISLVEISLFCLPNNS